MVVVVVEGGWERNGGGCGGDDEEGVRYCSVWSSDGDGDGDEGRMAADILECFVLHS